MEKTIILVPIDYRMSPKKLLSVIDNDSPVITQENMRYGVQGFHLIPVWFIPLNRACSTTSELTCLMSEKLRQNECRSLSVFESLTLNLLKPRFQIEEYPFVTFDLAFGVSKEDLHDQPDKSLHGNCMYTLGRFSRKGTIHTLRVAGTPLTAVDRDIFEDIVIAENLLALQIQDQDKKRK